MIDWFIDSLIDWLMIDDWWLMIDDDDDEDDDDDDDGYDGEHRWLNFLWGEAPISRGN